MFRALCAARGMQGRGTAEGDQGLFRLLILASCAVLAASAAAWAVALPGPARPQPVPLYQAVAQAGPDAVTAHLLRPRPSSGAQAVATGSPVRHGGPVQAQPRMYVDFWGWTSDPSGERPYLDRFLSSAGGTGWLATAGQYGGGTAGNLLAGTWSDRTPIPAHPSDAQIQAEAQTAAIHFGTGTSVNVDIVVATPTGHSTPGFGVAFCGYHGAITADPDVAYTNLPYITDAGSACGEGSVNGAAGKLDGVSIVAGHELAEVITDPLLDAWTDSGGNEIGDKCAWSRLGDIDTATGTFPVQALWSNAANACVLSTGGGTATYQTVFGASTGGLRTAGADGPGQWEPTLMPGTSPTVAVLTDGGCETAFQDTTGELWTVGAGNHRAWRLPVKAGTSPAIAGLASGGYEVAFQATTGTLWTVGTAGNTSWALAMMPGTSPAVAALAGGGYVVAFQSTTGMLWTVGTAGDTAWGLAMAPGASPAITGLPRGGYEIAFTDGAGRLWTAGVDGRRAWHLPVKAGTNPAIAALAHGGYEVAFTDGTGHLWTGGAGGRRAWQAVVKPGTSPAIAGLSNGGYEVAFADRAGTLWTAGADSHGAWNAALPPGSSPAITW